jgi:phage N-6-adenine-methyltransferase
MTNPTQNPLAKLSDATRMLAEARTLDEIKSVKDTAVAAQAYARARGLGEEAERYATEIRLEAARRIGQVWKAAKDAGETDRGAAQTQSQRATALGLSDIGITKDESSASQTLASVPEEDWPVLKAEALAEGVRTERKMAEVIKRPHVANNSGNNEWYTPPEYIAAAQAVMGAIDLDPASSETANKIVGAHKYYTAQDDGLAHHWQGRVWMNPPYASNLVGSFIDKLIISEDVTEAIVLVNNATDTAWFHALAAQASLIAFPKGRIRFVSPDGELGAPLQGQAIFYCGGSHYSEFELEFGRFGIIAKL